MVQAKRRLERPHESTAFDRGSVLIHGTGGRAERVAALFRGLGIDSSLESEPRAGLEALDARIRLVVIVPPLPNLSAEAICRRIRERAEAAELPVFVVGSSSRQARRLYGAGATGQFDWPKERSALVRAVLRLATPRGGAGPRDPRDVALAARIDERLLAERDVFGSLVTAQTRQGVVILGGEVDAAWKIPELARTLSAMPGVDEVVTAGVRVPVSGISDRVIASSIRGLLDRASQLEDRTFDVRVSNGQVTLAGTASSRREMRRVVGLIEQVEGVRSVDNLVVISQRAKTRDRTLATRLSRLMRGQFPRARVDASVFGGIAVLRGKARGAAERQAIESLVADQPGVVRVVSKVS